MGKIFRFKPGDLIINHIIGGAKIYLILSINTDDVKTRERIFSLKDGRIGDFKYDYKTYDFLENKIYKCDNDSLVGRKSILLSGPSENT